MPVDKSCANDNNIAITIQESQVPTTFVIKTLFDYLEYPSTLLHIDIRD